MVRVGVIVPRRPFLSPLTTPPAFPRAPTRQPPAPDQPAGLDMGGAGSGPGLPLLGTCPAAPAFAVAPMPTDWPECGRLGPGPVPTDTASRACPALGQTLTPRVLCSWLHHSCPASCFQKDPGGLRVRQPCLASPGEAREHPRWVSCSPPAPLPRLPPGAPLFLPLSPPPSERLCPRVLVGTGSQRGGWGFRAWVSVSCPAPTPHPEEVSVRTGTSGRSGMQDPLPGGVSTSQSWARADGPGASMG